MSSSNQLKDGSDQSKKAVKPNEWPVSEGRYRVGNAESPIAVCTMASVDMELPMDKIAIAGKCVTENLGVEKIIKNTVSNPKIRYIIFSGKESQGHFVGQSVKSLKDNGIDEEKRIIGAKGGMPILKNLHPEEIERFRKQIEVIDMSGETDTVKVLAKVNELFENNPGPFEGGSMEIQEEIKESIAGTHTVSEWVKDPQGFFTIRPDTDKSHIVAEHHDNEGKLKGRIFGESAEDIYHHIISNSLISRQDHAAYLGRELAKAEIAMRNSLDYEQDADLKISNGNIEQESRTGAESKTGKVAEPAADTEPEVPAETAASEPVEQKSLESLMEQSMAKAAQINAEDRARMEAETGKEPKGETKKEGRYLTYFKGFKEIQLEDSTKPDNEFRALLKERGLSRIF